MTQKAWKSIGNNSDCEPSMNKYHTAQFGWLSWKLKNCAHYFFPAADVVIDEQVHVDFLLTCT